MSRNLILVCAAAWIAGACTAVPVIGVTPRVGPMEIDGDIAASSSGAGGSSMDSLGMDDDSGLLAPRVDAAWLGFDAWASWFDARFTGTGAAGDQLDLGGVVIADDEPTDTEFDILLGTSGLTHDFLPGDALDLGLGLGIAYVDFDANITSQVSSESIRATEDFALPLLAGRAAVRFGEAELSLVAAGLALDLDDEKVSVFDADLMLRWSFLDAGPAQGGLVLGYCVTEVGAEYDDSGSTVDADLGFRGPYAGLSLRF